MKLFGFNIGIGNESKAELPEIFPLSLTQAVFIESDIINTYKKILTDVIERTHGLKKELHPLLWDNCVQSESSDGLITLLAKAMYEKSDLFLVYSPSVKVLRKADQKETEIIQKDYKEKGESKTGVFISFRNYTRTDMLKIYSGFEHCLMGSLNKTLNLSKSIQIKINELRSSVGLSDSVIAKDQARAIADGLQKGLAVWMDAKDLIETAAVDMGPTEKAMAFLAEKRAFVLGSPTSYLSGDQTSGIGSTGEADTRAVDRCLRQFFVSIIHPSLKALFGVDTEFKSNDFRQMGTALEMLKTFDLTEDVYLSGKTKQDIVARVFDLDTDEERKNIEAENEEVQANVAENAQRVNDDPTQAQSQAS